jgi:hypothetical protein
VGSLHITVSNKNSGRSRDLPFFGTFHKRPGTKQEKSQSMKLSTYKNGAEDSGSDRKGTKKIACENILRR